MNEILVFYSYDSYLLFIWEYEHVECHSGGLHVLVVHPALFKYPHIFFVVTTNKYTMLCILTKAYVGALFFWEDTLVISLVCASCSPYM